MVKRLRTLPAIETALSRFTRGLLRAIAPTDEAQRDLLTRAGLPAGCSVGPYSDEVARQLWRAAEQYGDDALGLHLAEATTLEDLGVLGYIARASATFGEACARAVKFERLLKDGAIVEIESDPAGSRIVELPVPGHPPWPRHLTEAILALWWIWPQRWAEVPCRPVRVRFQHARPASTGEHERVFGCPLQFDQPRNELIVAPDVWALPLPSADPLLVRYLEPVAEGDLERLAAEDPLLRSVRNKLLEMMPSGTIDVGRLARAVGMSRRTLHRRLAERGLTYQELADTLRRQTALRLLEARQHSFMEVAFLVGFSDASSLRRAHRRWTQERASGRSANGQRQPPVA